VEDERRGCGEGEDGAATNWEVDVSDCLRESPLWMDMQDFVLDLFGGHARVRAVAKRAFRPEVSRLRARLSPVVVRSGSKFQRRRA
jgi:hypothetical protein